MSGKTSAAEANDGEYQKISAAVKYEEVSKLVVKFGPWYEKLGAGGFLIVGGFSLVVSTISMSFYSGTDEKGQLFGITFLEEVLFTVISLIFAGIGAFLVNKKSTGMAEGVMGVLDRDLELEKFHAEMRLREMELKQNRAQEVPYFDLEKMGVKTSTAIDKLREAGRSM